MDLTLGRAWLPAPGPWLLLSVARANGRLDVPAHVEVAVDFNRERIAGVHEVFENHVDDVLVKDLHVAKRIDIELQTLQFDAALVGNIFQPNGREIRKVRERTDTGEFRNLKVDLDFLAGEFIGKRVERIKIHLGP